MCFSFLKEKSGKLLPLPEVAEDAISLMKAFDIIDNKLKTFIGFLNDEKIEKMESFYKIYYPVYMVEMEGIVVCIDALNLHKTEITEFLDLRGRDQKVHEYALLEIADLLRWRSATFEGRIDDGFAIPCALDKEGALTIAKEVLAIYKSLKDKIESLKEEMAREEERFQRNIKVVKEEMNKVEREFEEKINEKRRKVERLLKVHEIEAIKKIRENYREQRKLLESKKRELENLLRCLQRDSMKIDEEMKKLNEILKEIREKLSDLSKKNRESIAGGKFDELKDVLDVLEKSHVSVKSLKMLEEEKSSKLNDLKKARSAIDGKIEEVKVLICKLTNDVNALPIKEELECRKAREDFLKSRRNVIDELNSLLKENKEKLREYYIKEEIVKEEFNLIRKEYNESLKIMEEKKKELEKYVFAIDDEVKDEVELLYIPYYLILKEDEVKVIEPILILKGGGVEYKKLSLNTEIVKLVSIKHLLSFVSEIEETFNLLSKKNKERILRGISVLRERRAINKLQESILLRQIEMQE